MKMLDLFSGIGGFSLAAHWTGKIKTVAFCEKDPYATKVLKKNFPGVPVNPDIKNLRNGGQYGSIDIVCGGFPCQPFSVAGKQRGRNDDRDLWPEMLRVIKEFRPAWVVGENVANFVNMELERTCVDLEAEGYKVQSFIIPACAIDAKHERKRTWIVAYSESSRYRRRMHKELSIQRSNVFKNKSQRRSLWSKNQRCVISEIQQPKTASKDIRSNYGFPDWLDRIKCLGNAIVPQVVYPIFKAITDQYELNNNFTELSLFEFEKEEGKSKCQTMLKK